MKTLTPYLMFDGTAREAMAFYHQCLGGELQLTPMMDDTGKPSTAPNARIMHSQLLLGGRAVVQASDMRCGETGVVSGVHVAIDCDSVEEIDRLFAAFSAEGKVEMPLGTMFWGARFGSLVDRFGVTWMFNCFLSPGGAQ